MPSSSYKARCRSSSHTDGRRSRSSQYNRHADMPEALGNYKLLNLVGMGRLGELYRARDMRAGRTVALRVVADEIEGDSDKRERFLRDASATAALSHQNIAALYEVGEDQGHLFLVSEFVPGETLTAVIAGRALNPRHALDYGIQLADGLAEGHASAILYRDLRPGNVIVNPKGTAKLLDFGLAAWTGGAVIGATSYLSPEQVSGDPVDQRTDIFSLGLMLFEMLTGKLPHHALTSGAGAVERPGKVAAPSRLNRALPRELDNVVLKMLATDLHQRYELAAMAAADLRSVAAAFNAGANVVSAATSPGPATPSRPARATAVRPLRRRQAAWIRPALVVAAIVGALLVAASVFGAHWLPPLIRVWQQMIGRAAGLMGGFRGWLA